MGESCLQLGSTSLPRISFAFHCLSVCCASPSDELLLSPAATPQLRQQFNQFIAVPANPWLKAFANILFYSCLLLYSLFLRLSCLFVDPLGFMFIVDIGTKLVLLLVDFLLY